VGHSDAVSLHYFAGAFGTCKSDEHEKTYPFMGAGRINLDKKQVTVMMPVVPNRVANIFNPS